MLREPGRGKILKGPQRLNLAFIFSWLVLFSTSNAAVAWSWGPEEEAQEVFGPFLSLGVQHQPPFLQVEPRSRDFKHRLRYRANADWMPVLSLGGENYFAKVAYSESWWSRGKTEYGRSQVGELNGGVFFGSEKQWVLLPSFRSQQGFAITNSSSASQTWQAGDSLLQYPELRLKAYQMDLTYVVWGDHLPLADILSASRSLSGNKGSFFMTLRGASLELTNPDPWLPEDVGYMYGSEAQLKSSRFRSGGGLLGYGHLFAEGPFYLSARLAFGTGIQERVYEVGTELLRNSSSIALAEFYLNTGLRKKWGFIRIDYSLQQAKYKTLESHLFLKTDSAQVHVGMYY